MDNGIPGHLDNGVQGHMDNGIQGHMNNGIPGHKVKFYEDAYCPKICHFWQSVVSIT